MSSPTPPFDASQAKKRAYLDRLLTSVDFTQAGRLNQLLRFLGDAAFDPSAPLLKETILGVEVFGRDPGYDPKADSIVRTEIRRLRLKLQDYYSGPGANDEFRIEIPKGSYQLSFIDNTKAPTIPTTPPPPPPPAIPPTPSKTSWRPYLAAAALLILTATSAILVARRDLFPSRTIASDPILLTQSTGQAIHPSLSADGNLLTYSYSAGDASGIYLLRSGTSDPQRLPGTRTRDFNPVVNPAGDTIAFLREEAPNQFALLVQPIASAQPQRWATLDRRDRVAWLPDNRRLIVSLRTNPSSPAALMLIDAAGSRTVLTSPPPGTLYDGAPALSPDNRQLAFTRATDQSIDEIFLLDLSPDFLPRSQPRQITTEKRRSGGFCFSPDGSALLVSLQRNRSLRSLWRIPLADPTRLERLPEAGLNAAYPTVAPKSGRVVYSVGTDDLNLYQLTNLSATPTANPISPSATLDSSPAISPDKSRIAFRSARAGASEIWIANLDGSQPKRLTSYNGPVTGSPRWSPDGQTIAYDTRWDGNADIYLISIDGKSNRKFTSLPTNEVVPSFSRDGRFLYYSSDQTGQWQIFKAPLDASTPPRQITTDGGFRPIESPDAQFLYYAKREPHSGLFRLPIQGGPEQLLHPLPASLWGGWTLSASGIYRTDLSAPPRIVFQPHAGPVRDIWTFKNTPVLFDGALDVSTDDNTLAFAQLDKAISDLYQINIAR